MSKELHLKLFLESSRRDDIAQAVDRALDSRDPEYIPYLEIYALSRGKLDEEKAQALTERLFAEPMLRKIYDRMREKAVKYTFPAQAAADDDSDGYPVINNGAEMCITPIVSSMIEHLVILEINTSLDLEVRAIAINCGVGEVIRRPIEAVQGTAGAYTLYLHENDPKDQEFLSQYKKADQSTVQLVE